MQILFSTLFIDQQATKALNERALLADHQRRIRALFEDLINIPELAPPRYCVTNRSGR